MPQNTESMNKRKFIIIALLALCLAALICAVCIAAAAPDAAAQGIKLKAKLKGLNTGSIKLTLYGEFPKDCSLETSIPQVFDSFEDSGSKLVPCYSELVKLTQLESDENKAVFSIDAKAAGEGRLVFDFSNGQGRQSRAAVHIKTDEELCFTDALIYFDEEPAETTAVLGEVYEARIKRTDNGIELRIPAVFLAFSTQYYDDSVISSVEISYEPKAQPDSSAEANTGTKAQPDSSTEANNGTNAQPDSSAEAQQDSNAGDSAVSGPDTASSSGEPAENGSFGGMAYTEYSAAEFNAAQEKNSGKTDNYADSDSCTAVISVQAFAEGCGNLVLQNGRDGKLLTIDLQVSECTEPFGEAGSFTIEILDSWCEDFDYNYD